MIPFRMLEPNVTRYVNIYQHPTSGEQHVGLFWDERVWAKYSLSNHWGVRACLRLVIHPKRKVS